MKILLVSGSHREQSQSGKVTRFAAERLKSMGVETDLIDLAGNPLPLWHNTAEKPYSPTGDVWAGYARRAQAAEGLVVVSPEWNGMVPSGLTNFLLHLGVPEVAHKPALIVTVTATMTNGSYPVDQLRLMGYKNSRMVYLPDHTIVRNVTKCLNGSEPENDGDRFVRARLDYNLTMLLAYAEALKPLRDANPVPAEFINGM